MHERVPQVGMFATCLRSIEQTARPANADRQSTVSGTARQAAPLPRHHEDV
jgi:hypothetical protein